MIEHAARDPEPIQYVAILADGDTPESYSTNPGEWGWDGGADDVAGVVAEIAETEDGGPGETVVECWHRGDTLFVIFACSYCRKDRPTILTAKKLDASVVTTGGIDFVALGKRTQRNMGVVHESFGPGTAGK